MSASSGFVLNDDMYAAAQPISWISPSGGTEEHMVGGWRQHGLDKAAQGEADWVDDLELEGALEFSGPAPMSGHAPTHKPRILVLYGSLRPESFSRKLALECAVSNKPHLPTLSCLKRACLSSRGWEVMRVRASDLDMSLDHAANSREVGQRREGLQSPRAAPA